LSTISVKDYLGNEIVRSNTPPAQDQGVHFHRHGYGE
jgi:hypothetical protein